MACLLWPDVHLGSRLQVANDKRVECHLSVICWGLPSHLS